MNAHQPIGVLATCPQVIASVALQHAAMDEVGDYADTLAAQPIVRSAILTPLQALVALLAECELTLDYRPSYRRAMADAHTAIVNAPRAAAPALHGSIELGSPREVA